MRRMANVSRDAGFVFFLALVDAAARRISLSLSFKSKPDGEMPLARLVEFNGMLYGTTSAGGTRCLLKGCGTVFSISVSGIEKVLYRNFFQNMVSFGSDRFGVGLRPKFF
jgi:uncharacterized repeat protein (TIGR03803 family)